ncbi:hypothetical protein AQJ84_00335 [Streptomyces resistomycificus]|uniref:hypothetical protein n=1 Tax=Streptomyces resistomycificus TaxID=67356 RepID=UPI0004AAB1BF|nr:hypothetical protein [Streptomyces resistomycificus]KUO02156.1 hypothetical protein AQJ84_00335 [Streptomyces resistomycificus]
MGQSPVARWSRGDHLKAGRTRTVIDEAERLHLLFCRPAMLLDSRVEDAETARIEDMVAVLDRAVARAEDLERQMQRAIVTMPGKTAVYASPAASSAG